MAYTGTDLNKAERGWVKSRSAINVKDYGAVGDGVTDDTEAIQNAINTLTSGGRVTISHGSFIISDVITILDNIELFIATDATVKAKDGSGSYVMFANDDATDGNIGIVITGGGVIDGNIDNRVSTTDYDIGISLKGCTNSRVENITIKNTPGDGIYFGKATDATGGSYLYAKNNTIDNANRNGISVVAGDNVYIDGNTFKNISKTADPGAGVDIEPNSGNTTSNIYVTNNNVYSAKKGLLATSAKGSVTMTNINFSTNNIIGAETGIYIQDVDYVGLYNNKIFSCDRDGLVLENCEYNNIVNNIIKDCNVVDGSYQGILLYLACKYNNISSNTITTSNPSLFQLYNIYESGTSVSNLFSNNILYPFRTAGLSKNGTDSRRLNNVQFSYDYNSYEFLLGQNKYTYGTAAPSTGTAVKGDKQFNSSTDAGEPIGWTCVASGSPGTWKPFGQIRTLGTITWNPGSLDDGVGETSAPITINGLALGDFVLASAPYDLQGITCTAYATGSNTAKIRLQNETGGTIDLASGTWTVFGIKNE